MRRVLALCAVAGIATSVFAVPASAAAGYYVIRWDKPASARSGTRT